MILILDLRSFRHSSFVTGTISVVEGRFRKEFDLNENYETIQLLEKFLPLLSSVEEVRIQETENDYHFVPAKVKEVRMDVYKYGVKQ